MTADDTSTGLPQWKEPEFQVHNTGKRIEVIAVFELLVLLYKEKCWHVLSCLCIARSTYSHSQKHKKYKENV